MKLLAAFFLSAALDAGTTCAGISKGYVELNPLYGPRPSCTRVVLTKAIPTVAIPLIVPKRHRKVALITGIIVNSFAFSWNLHQMRKNG